MRSESFRKGVKDGIPIGLGYFAVSFTFGMMAVADGLSIWQAVLISLTNVTSAGQFAGLEIMVMSGSYWEMALTQLIINLRYCLMSFSLAQKFRRDESLVHIYPSIFHSSLPFRCIGKFVLFIQNIRNWEKSSFKNLIQTFRSI